MKKAIIFLIVFLTFNCFSAVINKYPVGDITKKSLLEQYDEFAQKYNKFSFERSAYIETEDITVKVLFGTWCHDSKREVPKMLKIFEAYGLEDKSISLVAVNPEKNEPITTINEFNLEFTPTFIFFRNGEEIGRIVEKPNQSLLEDFKLIIST